MNFVEKHSKLLAVALCLCASGPILSTVHAYEVQPGWHEDGDTAYYIDDNHQRATGLVEIDDSTYYFAPNGEMQTGWQNVKNEIYYFDTNGQALTGTNRIQGSLYNFQQSGSLQQGWNGNSYYNEKGFKEENAWIKENGTTFRVDENGNAIRNETASIDGDLFRFDENGEMQVGLFSVDDDQFITDERGKILEDTFASTVQGVVYAGPGGALNKTETLELNNNTYQFIQVDNTFVLENTTQTPPAPEATEVPEAGQPIDNPEPAPEPAPEPQPDPEPAPAPVEPEAPVIDEPVYEEPVVDEPVYEEPVFGTPIEEDFVNDWTPEEIVPEAPAYDEDYFEWIVEEPTVDENYTEDFYEEPSYSGSGEVASTVLAAAYAQLGVSQDCTALVSNALAAAGISHHGWPDSYASLGTYTSSPVPGDIIIYSGHVAIYAGDGMAIHGGWNGYTTAIAPVNCSQALIGYIHI